MYPLLWWQVIRGGIATERIRTSLGLHDYCLDHLQNKILRKLTE